MRPLDRQIDMPDPVSLQLIVQLDDETAARRAPKSLRGPVQRSQRPIAVNAEQTVRPTGRPKRCRQDKILLETKVPVQQQLPLRIGQQVDRGGWLRPETLDSHRNRNITPLTAGQARPAVQERGSDSRRQTGTSLRILHQFRQHRRQCNAGRRSSKRRMVLRSTEVGVRQLGSTQQLQGLHVGQRGAIDQAAKPLHRIPCRTGAGSHRDGLYPAATRATASRPARPTAPQAAPATAMSAPAARPTAAVRSGRHQGLAVEAPGAGGALQQHGTEVPWARPEVIMP